mgnify:CR=1 FL=1
MENPFETIIDQLDRIERKLSELYAKVENIKSNKAENEIMSLNRLTEYLELSKSSIYKLTSTKEIPHIKRVKKLFFNKTEIDKWISENRIKTRSEIQEEAMSFILKKGKR